MKYKTVGTVCFTREACNRGPGDMVTWREREPGIEGEDGNDQQRLRRSRDVAHRPARRFNTSDS